MDKQSGNIKLAPESLLTTASQSLSLLARSIVSGAQFREHQGVIVMTIRSSDAHLLLMQRLRNEIIEAVQLTWGMGVRFERLV